MNHTLLLVTGAVLLGAAPCAQAEPLPTSFFASSIQARQSQWQPTISVGSSAHGLALRSRPIAALDAGNSDSEPSAEPSEASGNSAPSGESNESRSSQGRRQGSRWGRVLSDSIGPFGLATGVFLLADGRHHAGQTRGALLGAGATAAATTLLKQVVRATRPNGDPHSFPSGHASAAFSFATAASYNHRNARLPLFALATAIAASRVDVRAHYARDVIAGAALGYGITRYFMRHSDRSATPSSSARGGLSFARSF